MVGVMARRILSEFRTKSLLANALGQPYEGVSVDSESAWQSKLAAQLKALKSPTFVVKVDQGVKGRFKKGLVKLDVAPAKVAPAVQELISQNYRFILVEPYLPHAKIAEKYLCLERVREGIRLLTHTRGGVDLNAATDRPTERLANAAGVKTSAAEIGLKPAALTALIKCFDESYFGFLEINPLIIGAGGRPQLLDAAAEVDAEAASIVAGRWSQADLREGNRRITPEEAAVLDLAHRSQSSFRLEVINPDGQVFVLLSGGGASVTLADEVNNQGFGRQLGNYGEYSGNPTTDETYVYTTQIISLLLKSKAKSKVLVIAGGVANFTDVRATFAGVINALDAATSQLIKQRIKIYVRRGGPHQTEGLATMKEFLQSKGLLGEVAGPEMLLSDIITKALASLKVEKTS